MPTPTGITLAADDIAITMDIASGITSYNPDNANTGIIEAIGSGVVADWAVSDVVLFSVSKDDLILLSDAGGNVFAICNKADIRLKYVAV